MDLTARGEKETTEINLTKAEFAALYLAAEGKLKKSSEQKKEVLCSLLVKMIPAIGWFSEGKSPVSTVQPKKLPKGQLLVKAGKKSSSPVVNSKPVKKSDSTQAVIETIMATTTDQVVTDQIQAVVDGQEETDTAGDKPVCKFYDAGRCKFSKKGGAEGDCPFRHPKTCRAFDRRGPAGCKSETCPNGKMHRKVCAELLKGKCLHKVGKCKFYHPPILSRNLEKQRKKKEDSAGEKSDIKNLMDYFKQPMFMIPFFLPAPCFPYLQQFFPGLSAKG